MPTSAASRSWSDIGAPTPCMSANASDTAKPWWPGLTTWPKPDSSIGGMLRSFRGGTDDGGSGTGSAHAEPVETRLGSGSGSMRATDVLSRPPVGSREKGTNAPRKGTVSVASRSVFHAPRVRGVEAHPPVPAVRVPGPARRPKAHLPERIRHRARDAAPRPTAGHARHLERLRDRPRHTTFCEHEESRETFLQVAFFRTGL